MAEEENRSKLPFISLPSKILLAFFCIYHEKGIKKIAGEKSPAIRYKGFQGILPITD